MAGPDPKPPRRVEDASALVRARLMFDECAACGRPPANGHHVVERGSPYFGDDVPENLVLLCGSGSFGCHGAVHGSPYVDHAGKRWSTAETRAAVGRHIARRRPDVVAYLLGKLGDGPGREYLHRRYDLSLP